MLISKKRIIITIILLLISLHLSFSQNQKEKEYWYDRIRIYAAYAYPLPLIGLKNIVDQFSLFQINIRSYSGYKVGVDYKVYKNLYLGASISTLYYTDDYKAFVDYITIAPVLLNISYEFRFPHFGVEPRLGLGYEFIHLNNYNISPLGRVRGAPGVTIDISGLVITAGLRLSYIPLEWLTIFTEINLDAAIKSDFSIMTPSIQIGVSFYPFRPIKRRKPYHPLAPFKIPRYPAPKPVSLFVMTVEEGTILSSIAEEYWNDSQYWPILFYRNREIIQDPDILFPGLQIEVYESIENLDPQYKQEAYDFATNFYIQLQESGDQSLLEIRRINFIMLLESRLLYYPESDGNL